ncbi:MAG: hypothetical protein N3G74_01680 [Candidatus Micrarchaeota archaeon]|nr:hypothetical protein [Candidatus Micrarchaeota archaeon]
MTETQFRSSVQISEQAPIRRGFASVGNRIRKFGSLITEGIFKEKPKFTKEQLEQAEQAWMRG